MPKVLFDNNADYASANEALIAHIDHLQSATLEASSEQTDGEVENVADGLTFDFWQPNATGDQTITADLGTSQTVDYFALGAHNLDEEITGDILLEHSDDGVDFTLFYTLAQADIIDAGPILVNLNTSSHRWWRWTIPTASTDLRLGVLQIGTLLQIQRTVYDGLSPPNLSREEVRIPNGSEAGHFLGTFLARSFFRATFTFEDLEPAWYRTFFDPFVLTSQTRPFFLAWRPDDFNTEVVFAQRIGNIRPTNTANEGLMSVSLDIRAVA